MVEMKGDLKVIGGKDQDWITEIEVQIQEVLPIEAVIDVTEEIMRKEKDLDTIEIQNIDLKEEVQVEV